jgi:hypothetical protein
MIALKATHFVLLVTQRQGRVCFLPFTRVPSCPLGLRWNPHIAWTSSWGSDHVDLRSAERYAGNSPLVESNNGCCMSIGELAVTRIDDESNFGVRLSNRIRDAGVR